MALVVHDAEEELSIGFPLLGKRTPLAKGRCIVASNIGYRTFFRPRPAGAVRPNVNPADSAAISARPANGALDVVTRTNTPALTLSN